MNVLLLTLPNCELATAKQLCDPKLSSMQHSKSSFTVNKLANEQLHIMSKSA